MDAYVDGYVDAQIRGHADTLMDERIQEEIEKQASPELFANAHSAGSMLQENVSDRNANLSVPQQRFRLKYRVTHKIKSSMLLYTREEVDGQIRSLAKAGIQTHMIHAPTDSCISLEQQQGRGALDWDSPCACDCRRRRRRTRRKQSVAEAADRWPLERMTCVEWQPSFATKTCAVFVIM